MKADKGAPKPKVEQKAVAVSGYGYFSDGCEIFSGLDTEHLPLEENTMYIYIRGLPTVGTIRQLRKLIKPIRKHVKYVKRQRFAASSTAA